MLLILLSHCSWLFFDLIVANCNVGISWSTSLIQIILHSFFMLKKNRNWNKLSFLFKIDISIRFFITKLNFLSCLSRSLICFGKAKLILMHFTTIHFHNMIMSDVVYKIIDVIVYNCDVIPSLHLFTAPKICSWAITKTILFCFSLSSKICSLIVFPLIAF